MVCAILSNIIPNLHAILGNVELTNLYLKSNALVIVFDSIQPKRYFVL